MKVELSETITLIVTEVRGELRSLSVKDELQYYLQWISTVYKMPQREERYCDGVERDRHYHGIKVHSIY